MEKTLELFFYAYENGKKTCTKRFTLEENEKFAQDIIFVMCLKYPVQLKRNKIMAH